MSDDQRRSAWRKHGDPDAYRRAEKRESGDLAVIALLKVAVSALKFQYSGVAAKDVSEEKSPF